MSTTISFQCYSCNQVLRVSADKAGKKAKCPKCATLLTIPFASAEPSPTPSAPASGVFPNLELDHAPPPSVPPLPPPRSAPPVPQQPLRVELVDEEPLPVLPPPRPSRYTAPPPVEDLEVLPLDNAAYAEEVYEPHRRGGGQTSPWFFVRLGLLLTFIGSCVWAGAFLLKMIGYLMLSVEVIAALTRTGVGGPPSYTYAILIRLGECLSVCGSLTALVGYVFCILGPKERGKLGLSIAVTAVAGLDLLLSLAFKLPFVFGGMGFFVGPDVQFRVFPEIGVNFGVWLMLVLCQLLFVAELILVPLYLGVVARDFHKRSHARSGTVLYFLGGGYGAMRLFTWIMYYVSLATIVAAFTSMRGGEPPKALFWITLILLWLGNFVYIAQVIFYTIFLWKSRDMVRVDGGR